MEYKGRGEKRMIMSRIVPGKRLRRRPRKRLSVGF